MVNWSMISSILVLAIGILAYIKLESTMNYISERQLLINPSHISYKMWKEMPVTMYQSFMFFNLTNWNQVKSQGHKPRFVEVGPFVYKTTWTKSAIDFKEDSEQVTYAEKKHWKFMPSLSKGSEDDFIWTINTPLMTALALIQNAPVLTRNIVSVILDGLGEGAFIRRNVRSLLFEGYSDLIVTVGPLFDKRFANFNGKFAYFYNKNDTIEGQWTVSTGSRDINDLNKIIKFQSNIVKMSNYKMTNAAPQGLNEVKPECASAWSLGDATNGQLFAPFSSSDSTVTSPSLPIASTSSTPLSSSSSSQIASSLQSQPNPAPSAANTFFHQLTHPSPSPLFASMRHLRDHRSDHQQQWQHQNHPSSQESTHHHQQQHQPQQHQPQQHQQQHASHSQMDGGKFMFYPDLCRPIHLLGSLKSKVNLPTGIKATRYHIDPRVFMNSTQFAPNKCFEMNPRLPLANALAASFNIQNSVPNLIANSPIASPFNALFNQSPQQQALSSNPASSISTNSQSSSASQQQVQALSDPTAGVADGPFVAERSNSYHQSTSLTPMFNLGQRTPISRLSRVRQLFTNIVSQRMSAGGSPILNGQPTTNSVGNMLLASLSGNSGSGLFGNHIASLTARNSLDDPMLGPSQSRESQQLSSSSSNQTPIMTGLPTSPIAATTTTSGLNPSTLQQTSQPQQQTTTTFQQQHQSQQQQQQQSTASDRWITQFRLKWPKGVFSIGQCQLGAPIYASLPHFLDADDFYLEQVDGLRPNRSLHEFYIDIESTLHAIPVNAKARLQINVATPELRFRNIPNAMIPVLWQEITFELDRPVKALLYWTFTMSGTIYNGVGMTLMGIGSMMTLMAFIRIVQGKDESNETQHITSSSPKNSRSSSSSKIRSRKMKKSCRSAESSPIAASRTRRKATNQSSSFTNGGIVNNGFTMCTDYPDNNQERNVLTKQSRNNHETCELMTSNVTTPHCMIACLKHGNEIQSTLDNNSNQQRQQIFDCNVDSCCETSDSSLVRANKMQQDIGVKTKQQQKLDTSNNNYIDKIPSGKDDRKMSSASLAIPLSSIPPMLRRSMPKVSTKS